MISYLKSFLVKYQFQKEAEDVLLSSLESLLNDKIANKLLNNAIDDYKQSVKIDYEAYLAELELISKKVGVNVFVSHLLFFILLTPQLQVYYKQSGYSQEMCDATILDLRYKMLECSLIKGVYGTFVPKWFIGFFTLEKFTLGRLQFRIIHYPINTVVDGVELTEKTPFIDVHIPRSGAKLDYNEVHKSYKMAVEFFKDKFNLETPVFFCSSWAMYPENLKVLKPDSNMAKFINDYKIVKVYEYENYSEVWRLFDTEFTGEIDKLPADTSLRQAYIDWIKQGKKTGGAIGVFVYNG